MDENQAELAGWLHDCARCYPNSKLESIWHQHPGYLDQEELVIPALWHAPVSALIAQSEFMVSDPVVIAAIRYHPTGRPGMGSLEKIVFVADYLEPNRKFKGVDALRKLANQGLNQITLAVMDSKLTYHRTQGFQLHSRGIAAYEYMKKQING